jgi:hypothetical protein
LRRATIDHQHKYFEDGWSLEKLYSPRIIPRLMGEFVLLRFWARTTGSRSAPLPKRIR